jgi:glycosyltransferase involved in cell wall biosynthesis
MLVEVTGSKRILLLAHTLHHGGSERQLTETAKVLHRSGWLVHVGCFHDLGARARELRDAGIPVVRFPVRSFMSFSAVGGVTAFIRYVLRHDIALTHAFDTPLTIFSTFAGRLCARGVVLSSQRSYRDLFTSTEQRLLRVTDRVVNGVVVNCEAIRRHLVEDESVRPDRVHLCYNGVDTNVFFPAPRLRPQPFGDSAVVIGTIAVLRAEKGLLTLVEAFAQVQRDYAQTKLLIVGSGPLRQQLEDTARSLGIGANVYFEPATSNVADWLNIMDIFVLPSLSEALSNSLMEAMACGVAPVASTVGGNPELVREGETGLLFAPKDAAALAAQLRRLVFDQALRRRFGAAAAAFISENMAIEKSSARMASIYEGFLEGRNGSAALY